MQIARIFWLVLLATVKLARADAVKGTLECNVYTADRDIKEAIKSGRRGKLAEPVECSIDTVGDYGNMSFTGHLHVVRHAAGKKLVSPGVDHVFGPLVEDTTTFHATLQPGTDFQPCEPFDVVAKILDGKRVLYTKTLAVATACPRPKPLAATVRCTQQDDGKTITFTTGKRFERVHGDIVCDVTSQDPRFANVRVVGDATWRNTGSGPGEAGTPGKQHVVASPGEGSTPAYDLAFGSADWDRCANMDVSVAVLDNDGNTLFSRTFKTQFTCGE